MEIDKLPNVKKYWINDGYLNIELKDNHRLRMNFNNIEILKEQLTLTDVSQQRELLKFFAKNWNENQTTRETCIEEFDIEECIKNFNCG